MKIRKLFDATPWNKDGYSFMGLKRKQAKLLGGALMAGGVWFMLPPGIGFPGDDLVNFGIAKAIELTFPFLGKLVPLFLAFFVVPLLVILLGAWIYPYHTKTLLFSLLKKAKKFLKSLWKKPLKLIFALLVTGALTFVYLKFL